MSRCCNSAPQTADDKPRLSEKSSASPIRAGGLVLRREGDLLDSKPQTRRMLDVDIHRGVQQCRVAQAAT